MPPPYSAGSVFLQVVPSFAGVQDEIGRHARAAAKKWAQEFDKDVAKDIGDGIERGVDEGTKRAQRGARDSGKKIGESLGREAGQAAGKELARTLDKTGDDAGKAGQKAGEKYAGKFATTLKRQVAAMNRQINAVRIEGNADHVIEEFAKVKAAAKAIGKATIDVDLDGETAVAAVHEMEKIVDRMSQDVDLNVRTRVDLDQAAREAAAVRKMVETVLAKNAVQIPTSVEMPNGLGAKAIGPGRNGKPFGALTERELGAFERTFRSSIEKALKDMPSLEISFDDDKVKAEVEKVRAGLQDLRGARIGTDMSTDEALAKLRELMAIVARIDGMTADVRVRSDADTAYKELRATFDLVQKLERADANVRVSASGAAGTAASLRNVQRAADGVDKKNRETSTSGLDAANAFRAFNGRILAFVTLAPAAIPLLAALAGGLAAIGPAALAGIAGAGVAAAGFSGISAAVKGLNDVQDNAVKGSADRARTMRSAARGVRDAEQSLARAREDAARSVEDAARRVDDAERRLTEAQTEARQAQEDLTAARVEGGRQLEDLALRARGGALAERAAALELAKAQAEYIATFQDGSSTNVEREEAAIALERAKLSLDEAKQSNKELAVEQQKTAKTGVEGTEAYQSALERVQSTQRGVEDAERSVADARRDSARAQADAARSIADAQQGLTDAQADYQDALHRTDDIGSSAFQRLQSAMAKLGPAGRAFAEYLHNLRPFLYDLRREAQEGFLPGLQRWMQTITSHYGPALKRTIGGIAGAVGDVFSQWGAALKSEPFAQLFAMIERSGPRFIRAMGDILTNLGKGIASLTVAVEPFTDLFLGWFRDLSAEFANWAASVRGSNGLSDFFDYVRRIGPEVGEFLSAVGRALLNLLEALAPYGETVLNLLTGILDWIAEMDPQQLGVIATGLLLTATAMQTVFGLTSLVKSSQAAWRLASGALGEFGGKVPLIAGGVVALVGGLAMLYSRSEAFRNLVDTLVKVLGDLVGALNGTVGPIGTVVTAVSGFLIVRSVTGYIRGMRGPMRELGTAADFLGGSFNGAAGKVGKFAKAAGLLGALLAAFDITTRTNADRVNEWADALRAGGTAADELRAKVAAAHKDEGGVGTFLKQTFLLSDLWDDSDPTQVIKDFNEAQRAADEARASMDPLSAAQDLVTQRTNELAVAQDRYGTNSDKARAASTRLKDAQDALARKQGNVEDATRDATDALADQADALLAAASSDLAMSQARLAATRAQDRYKKVLADGKATADDRTEAENELRGAYLQVASAALRQAQDQAALRGETLSGVEGANAQLEALKALRDEMGGDLPDAIAGLITDLENTAGKATSVSEAMDGVTGAIDAIPGQKDVWVNGITEEAAGKLEDLGLDVKHFPDGRTEIIAHTEAAQAVLDLFIAEAQKRKAIIPVELKYPVLSDILYGRPQQQGDYHGEAPGGPLIGLPLPPHKADGGPISGPGTETSDSVPILASDGEYMIRASSVRKYGRSFFDMLNVGRFAIGGLISRSLPRFADGGAIDIPRWASPMGLRDNAGPLAEFWGKTLDDLGRMTGDAAPALGAMWTALIRGMKDETGAGLTEIERRFTTMQTTVERVVGDTRDRVGTAWGGLRDKTAEPVNFFIDAVLNRGLFPALNSVATAFGLDKTIAAAKPIDIPRLAVGGTVPGSSPTKTADNIPIMATAGEFMQPVDAVDYYGVDFMEALRRKQIPRFATGGQVGTWPKLDAIRRRLFPNSVLTSAYRPGAHDWHGAGNAIDIGVPGNDPAQLAPIARRIAILFPQSTELINNPGGSIKNGRPVPPTFWGRETWLAHADHVHWAETAEALALGMLGVGSGDIPNALADAIAAPIEQLFAGFGRNTFTQTLAGAGRGLADAAWASLAGGDEATAPTLYDGGGYLPPGLSMVLNGTGKPEPVLTAEELELLRGGAAGGGRRELIGNLTIPMVQADPYELTDELVHTLAVVSAGGRYDPTEASS